MSNNDIFIPLFYLLYIVGFAAIACGVPLYRWYIAIIIFFTFKWIFNYRKCTFSYIECMLRNVKKEQGILYNFLENSVNLRYSRHIPIYYMLSAIILVHYFYWKGNRFDDII